MKPVTWGLVLVMAVVVGMIAIDFGGRVRGAETVTAVGGPSARYQLCTLPDSGVWMVDTTTGDTWYRPVSGKWQFRGNPTGVTK